VAHLHPLKPLRGTRLTPVRETPFTDIYSTLAPSQRCGGSDRSTALSVPALPARRRSFFQTAT